MKGIITGRRTEKTDPTFFTSGVERVLYYTNPPYDVSIIKKKTSPKERERETEEVDAAAAAAVVVYILFNDHA